MKYIALFGLIALQTYTSIQLIEARHKVIALQDVDNASDTFYGADTDGEDWQPIQDSVEYR